MRQPFIASTLLLLAFSSAALTLGRSRGAVLVGQPLDVRIQVSLEQGEDPAALCFDADVFHADTQVEASRVTTRLESAAAGREATVRVRSAAIVDEPVVTVYLKAGCTQKFTRRYVFLADVIPDAVSVQATSAAPVSLAAAGAQAAAAAAPSGANPGVAAGPQAGTPRGPGSARKERKAGGATGVADAPGPAASQQPVKAESSRAVATEKPARPVSVVRRKADAQPGRARLHLDPLDLVAERDPTLRASTEMLTQPTDNPQRRAEAAALWRAINAQPQDVLRDIQRIQTLESDVKGLRDLSGKTQASLVDLKSQLQKAESERYANFLVYGLASALVLALGLVGFLFWRGNGRNAWSGNEWWRSRDLMDEGDADDLVNGRDSLMQAATAARAQGRPAPVSDVDVDLDVNEEMFATLKKSGPVAQPPARAATSTGPLPKLDHTDFAPSMPGSPRAVNAEELFDIQQQADFFVSLGQYDQAIEVLKNHIDDNVQTSALAYLDLLKIYHKLGRKDEYDRLRTDFNQGFNAQVPVWEHFSEQSSGLEAYQKALSRIEALWPSPKVLEIIEESIFRKPGMVEGEAFDLEAYRELLLLYAIAKELVETAHSSMDFEFSSSLGGPASDGDSPRSKFSATNIQPLSASLPLISSLPDSRPDLSMPRPSPRLGLDIDLSEEPGSAFLEPEVSDGQSISGHGDSHPGLSQIADIDLFDPATENDIAPRRPRR